MLLIRYIAYFISIALVALLLTQLEISFPGALRLQVFTSSSDLIGTSAYSPVEIIQALILVICGLLLVWIATHCPAQRPIAILFGGLALIFLLHELDFFLDTYIVVNSWRVMIAVVAALIIVYCYRHWRRFRIAWFRVWPSPGLTLYFAGAVVVFGCVPFIGYDVFWRALMGDGYHSIVSVAVEEFIEFIGYALWLIGTVEFVFQARAISRQEPQTVVAKRRAQRQPKSQGKF
jgi:hypothetical protein